jgi:tRNA (guanine-N7-)-methyltransferase
MQQRKIRSFVKRGRLTTGQRQALDVIGPRFVLPLTTTPPDFGVIFGREADLVLDIGFGNGESLLAFAADHPENNYLGVEVYGVGVASLLAGIEKQGLENIRIYHCDVNDVLNQCIKDESLSKINILFPDPWPKKRHHKRRLIQPEFVALLHTKLKVAGHLHLATDWPHYAAHMEKVMNGVQGFAVEPVALSRPMTKFARRAERVGSEFFDFIYIKQ